MIITAGQSVAADLTLGCEGTQRKIGTAYERDIYFELEFYWETGAYRMFQIREGNIRSLMGEGRASEGNNQIIWGKLDRFVIDRKTGSMVRKYSRNEEDIVENMTCSPIDNTGNRF